MSSRTTLILAWVVHGAVSFDQVMLRLKRYKFWKIQRMEVYICVKLPVTDFKPFWEERLISPCRKIFKRKDVNKVNTLVQLTEIHGFEILDLAIPV